MKFTASSENAIVCSLLYSVSLELWWDDQYVIIAVVYWGQFMMAGNPVFTVESLEGGGAVPSLGRLEG